MCRSFVRIAVVGRRRNSGAADVRGWLAAGLLAAVSLVAAGAESDPPQWSRRRWAIADGGEPASGRAVAALPDGAIMIATDRGLVRFDGHRFTPVPFDVSESPVIQMLATRGGDLHVLQRSGRHVVFDRRAGRQRIVPRRPPASTAAADSKGFEPTSLCEDHAGDVWVGHRNGAVKRVTPRGVEWLPPDAPRPEPMAWVGSDPAGRVWRIEEGRLSLWRDAGFVAVAALPPGKVALTAARTGGVWIQAGSKLFHCSGDTAPGGESALREVVSFEVGSPTNLRLLEDRAGCLWVGTSRHGLSVVVPPAAGTAPGHSAPATAADGPPVVQPVATSGGSIFAIVADQDGNVWAGTTAGIERICPAAVWRTGNPTALPLRTVCCDAAGSLWFVTLDGRLGRERRCAGGLPPPALTRHDAIDFPLRDGEEAITDATCVAPAPDGGVWVGTRRRGILWCDGVRCRALPLPDDLDGAIVSALLTTRSGGLVAGIGDALAWREGEAWRRLQEPVRAGRSGGSGDELETSAEQRSGAGAPGAVGLLVEDASGRIWAALANGELAAIESPGGGWGRSDAAPETTAVTPGAERSARVVEQLRTAGLAAADGGVTAICPLPGGSVWIGLRTGGLCRWRDGRVSRLSMAQGLPSPTVLAVVADGRGRLWCASDRRMYAIGVEEAEAVADGRRDACHCWSLPGQDEVTFFEPAIVPPGIGLLDASGRVLVILPTGVAVCDPARLPAAVTPAVPGVDDVLVDGRSLPPAATAWRSDRFPSREVVVPPGARRVELRFSERALGATTNVRLQHRLEGIDDGWVNSPPTRAVSYERVPSGRRRFRLRSTTDGTADESLGWPLVIDFEPPLWERTWFRGGVVLAVGAVAVGATALVLSGRARRRIAAVERLAALDQERMRIARDMHDEVGTNLTQIALLARVARARAAAEEHPTLDAMAAIARETAAAFDEIVWAINPAHDTLPHLLSYLLKRADETLRRFGVDCVIDAPQGVAPLPASVEFRRNVMLIAKEAVGNVVKHAQARRVAITARVADRRLVFSVRDDGRGIAAADRLRGRSGLGNMQARAAALGGTCRIEAVAGGGTQVTVDVPIP